MEHFLRVGQSFRCRRFRDLVYGLKDGVRPPELDRSSLSFDHAKRVTVHWTESREDGWERRREDVVDRSVSDPDAVSCELFTVVRVDLTGGGAGHGPHDVFPDGHLVVARGESGRTVRFFQSGCFVGVVPPSEVEFVDGPPDLPGAWRKEVVRTYEVSERP